jgi:hypothetical protein
MRTTLFVITFFVATLATFGQRANQGTPQLSEEEKSHAVFVPTLDKPQPSETFVAPMPAVVADRLIPVPQKPPVFRSMKSRPVAAYRIAPLKRPLEAAAKVSGQVLDFTAQNDPCSFDDSCSDSRKDGGSNFQRVKK